MTTRVKCGHTALDLDCRHCRKLAEVWEKKLQKTGDGNIEQEDGNLKRWDSFRFGRHGAHLLNLPAREEYYRLAGQFLWDHPFKTKKIRRMWELHSEGLSIEDIVKKVKKERGHTYKRLVHETLQALTKEMLEKCRK